MRLPSGIARHPLHATAMLALVLLPAACASVRDAGWHGQGAEPFDAAHRACESETAATPKAEHESAFEACMARRGWTRP